MDNREQAIKQVMDLAIAAKEMGHNEVISAVVKDDAVPVDVRLALVARLIVRFRLDVRGSIA